MPVTRTLPPLLFSFILGIISARYAYFLQNPIILFVAIIFLLLSLFVLAKTGKGSFVLPVTLFFALGALAFSCSSPRISLPGGIYNRKNIVWTGNVVSYLDLKKYGGRLVFSVQTAQVDNKKYPVRGFVQLNFRRVYRKWYPGIQAVSSFVLKDFRNFQNPGAFDYRKFMRERGYIGKAYLPSDMFLASIGSVRNPWGSTISYIRIHSFDFLMNRLRNPESSVYAALLLGMKKQIPGYIREAFNVTGVSHLLAISGLHLGLLGGILYFIFSYLFSSWEWALLKIGKNRLSLLCTIPFVFFYAEITGLSLPTKRAMLMVIITLIVLLIRRSRDFWQILALVAFLILADQPFSLFLPSFQLSFAALVAIVYLGPKLKELLKFSRIESYHRGVRIVTDAFIVSLSATIGVAPLLAYHFHMVSFMGIFANLMIIPLIGFVALPVGLVALAASFADPSLASLVIWPGALALRTALKIILQLSQMRLWLFFLPHFSLIQAVLIYVLLFVAFHSFSFHKKVLSSGVLVLAFLLLEIPFHHRTPADERKNIAMTVMDVGRGTSILVRFPTGENMLIEGGNYSYSTFDAGKHVVAPYLWEKRVRKINYLVLASTYPRCTTLPFTPQAFEIEELWHTGIGLRGYAFRECFRFLAKGNCIKRELEELRCIHTGRVICQVLYPSLREIHRATEPPYHGQYSMLLTFDFLKTRLILFPSCLPVSQISNIERENSCKNRQKKTALIAYGKPENEFALKSVLQLFSPQFVIFSPEQPQSLARIISISKIKWFSTKKNGALQITSNGENIHVVPFTDTSSKHLEGHLSQP